MHQGHAYIFHRKIKLCTKRSLLLINAGPNLFDSSNGAPPENTQLGEKGDPKTLDPAQAPVFPGSVLLGSAPSPWMDRTCKIAHSWDGFSQWCCCAQCRRSSSFLPSICAQRTQLKPEAGAPGRAMWGLGCTGPWGASPG